jgi:hypothetical protein
VLRGTPESSPARRQACEGWSGSPAHRPRCGPITSERRRVSERPKLLHGQGAGGFRRSGLLERVSSPVRQGERYPLPHQPSRYQQQAPEQVPEAGQPLSFERSGARRACLPRGKAIVGLHQGALSWAGQEHRPTLYRLCSGEPVPAQTTADRATGEVSLVNRKKPRRLEDR